MSKLKLLKGKGNVSQIKMGALISYFAMAINIITAMFYTPWMVQTIGKNNYGLYTLAHSLIMIFMLDFGLGSAVSRFVSKYRAEGNQDAVNNIISVIFKLYIAIDVCVMIVLTGIYFFLSSIYVKLTPQEIETFKVLYIMVGCFQLISFPLSPLNGILNAYEKFIQLKLCDVFHKISTVAFVVIALSFKGNVIVVVGANILSGLLTILAKFLVVKTKIPLRVNIKAGDKKTYKTLFNFTVWTTIISIMQRFTHSFSPSVLGITSGAEEVAYYSPAVMLEGHFYTLGTAVNGLFLPRIAKHVAKGEEDKILSLMIKVGRYQLTVLGLVFIGFVCVGRDFMVLWMKDETFIKSYYCAILLLFPTLISCSQQIANTTVIAKNLVKYQAKFVMISGTVGLIIGFVSSMFLGAIGVCLGTASASIANIIYMSGIYQRKAGIKMSVFYKNCWIKAIPCFVLIIILGFIAAHFINISGWLGLIVKSGVVAIIYGLVMMFLYFNKEDRKGISKRLKLRN